MATLTGLQDELLQCIAAFLSDYDVVWLRFCCRQMQRAIKPPKPTQLCPGSWRVPQSASAHAEEALKNCLQGRSSNLPNLQWGYLLDFTGERQ